jgi:protein TonB
MIIDVVIFCLLAIGTIRLLMFNKSPEAIVDANAGSEEHNSIFVKKYKQADVFRHSSTFILIGTLYALSMVLVAFQITEKQEVAVMEVKFEGLDDVEVEVPPTFREPTPPPPPPPPQIQVVDDEEIIQEQPKFQVDEITVDEVIAPPAPVVQENVVEDEIFKVVEEMPEFPGGSQALMGFLAKTAYPPFARENDLEGTVYIQFVIDKGGKITEAVIARSSGHKILDDAALAHVKTMPSWKPGKQRGKPVRVQYVVPIKFKLS